MIAGSLALRRALDLALAIAVTVAVLIAVALAKSQRAGQYCRCQNQSVSHLHFSL